MASKARAKEYRSRPEVKQRNKEYARKKNQEPAYRWSMIETRRRYHLNRFYGMTLEHFNELFEAQNGLCAVCRQPETGIRRGVRKSLDVDHNHTTGQIRGLLCSKCNAALGLLMEDPLRIRALLSYLEHYNGV